MEEKKKTNKAKVQLRDLARTKKVYKMLTDKDADCGFLLKIIHISQERKRSFK